MSRIDGTTREKRTDTQVYTEYEGWERFHRLSTPRFIAERDEVSGALIHLPSFTFGTHGSRLGDSLITMTFMSDIECALLLKCLDTGDTSVLRCVMSDR